MMVVSAATSSTVPTVPLHVARAKQNRLSSNTSSPPKEASITPVREAPLREIPVKAASRQPLPLDTKSWSKGIRHISLPIPPAYITYPQLVEEGEAGIPEGKRVSGFFRNGISSTPTSDEGSVLSGGSEMFRPLKQRSSTRWSSISRRSRNNDNNSIKS